MFMLSAVIVGVTLGVQNLSPTEAATLQYTRTITEPNQGFTRTVNVFAPNSWSFTVTPTVFFGGHFSSFESGDASFEVHPTSGYQIVSGSSFQWVFGNSTGTGGGTGTHSVTIGAIPPPTVTTHATLRRTDTNATFPWSNTGAPNQNVTINPTSFFGTPTPPPNHEFVGWSPATRTVNRGNGTNHGTLDFTPIFEPLAPTIHSATFHLHGGRIGNLDQPYQDMPHIGTYTNPQIDGMRTTQPRNPVRLGYTFTGWFTQQYGGDPFDFLTPKNSNQTIHAQWEPISGNVVILHFAGGLTHNETVWHFNTGRPYTLRLPGWEIMGENFLGWFDTVERVGTPVIMISETAVGPQHLFALWG